MALGQDAVQVGLVQDDSLAQGREEVAASGVPVPVWSCQPPPLLLRLRHEPLVGQIPKGLLGLFPCQPSLLPWAELAGPELVPEGPEAEVRVHQLSAQGEEIDCGGVSCDFQGLPEGGAGEVWGGLTGVHAEEGGDDGPSLGS